MKKNIFLCLLLLLSINRTIAQNDVPPPYEIKVDTATYIHLPDSCWNMFEDRKNTLTFNQARSLSITNQFHYNNKKNNEFDYSVHNYWFFYRLKNVMNHPADIAFSSSSEQSTFYFIKNGKLAQFENGSFSPWRKSAGLSLNRTITLVLKPLEELVVYNKVQNKYSYFVSPREFFVGFAFTKSLLKQSNIEDERLYINGIHDSILFGVLLFACLFNFFFYLIVKEKVYLHFSLYLIFLGIGRMTDEFYFVFLREHHVFWVHLYQDLIWPFTFFALTFFIRSLLRTRHYIPRWDNFLNGVNYVYIIYCLVLIIVLFDHSINTTIPFFLIEEGLRILLIILYLLSFFLILRKRDNPNKVLMNAILPAFFIWGVGYSLEIIYLDTRRIIFSLAVTNWLHEWWYYIETFCISWLVLFYSWVLLQRFRQLQKKIIQQALEKEKEKSQMIEQQKIELEKTVEQRTFELKYSLDELKTTQAQLIQSEKMASLGELTAGIAHEIQNPLNFVNNFSEVNKELLIEMKAEIDKGNLDEAKFVADNVIENEEKINHHGKRADGIVKGMLQHSRNSLGVKELTDINALADEYLRLSYEGFRAKDKSFNVTIQTDFDRGLSSIEGKINIIPQEIGRVLLNLYNNAFYAVAERLRQAQPDSNYEPTVSVSTKKINNKPGSYRVEISIKDNGNGIPQKALDKIFQPFFTTKPTGQGTGLGLSLSYDTVRAHGGEIKVETTEGKGAEFVISLQIS